MPLPHPFAGLVIRYSYLWLSEHRSGAEEGRKDRPCAIVLVATKAQKVTEVTVLPVTHTPPAVGDAAIEILASVKARLGLDDQRSWVVLTEANRFNWPGPDLRPSKPGDVESVAFGPLPFAFFERVRVGFLEALKDHRVSTIVRTE